MIMRRLLLGLVAALALGATAPAHAATVNVTITKDGFVPRDVTVQVGETVTWTNADASVHQVRATNGAFLSPPLTNGQIYYYAAFVHRASAPPDTLSDLRPTVPVRCCSSSTSNCDPASRGRCRTWSPCCG